MAEFVSPFDTDLFMTNQGGRESGHRPVPGAAHLRMGGLLAFACKSEGGSLSFEASLLNR